MTNPIRSVKTGRVYAPKRKSSLKLPDETYEQYCERVKEANVEPLPYIKWHTLIKASSVRIL